MKIVLSVTGASGVGVGYRLAAELCRKGHELLGIETEAARHVARFESPGVGFPDQVPVYRDGDRDAPMNSSSFRFDAMAVVPCSLKSLAALAHGLADTVTVRAADVALRTGRKLVLAPRETPLSASALENMLSLRRDGALIAPLMVGFYTRPASLEEMTSFLVGKLMDLLGVENDLFPRWPDVALPTDGAPKT